WKSVLTARPPTSLVPLPWSSIVLMMSMPGSRVLAPPMSDHRTIPSASAAVLSTFARSVALWARAGRTASAVTSRRSHVVVIQAFAGLMVLFRHDVSQVAFAAWLRFRQHRIRPRIQHGDTWRRPPRLEQEVGILHRRGPRQRVSVAPEALDHVHVLPVNIASYLIEPCVARKPPGVNDERVVLPVGNALSGIRTVEILQGSVFAAIGR